MRGVSCAGAEFAVSHFVVGRQLFCVRADVGAYTSKAHFLSYHSWLLCSLSCSNALLVPVTIL